MTDNTFSMTMRSFWATVAIIAVAILGIGLAIGMASGRRAPRPCANAAWAPEFVQGQWVCLAFPDKYICNINGRAQTFRKDGEAVIDPTPKLERDPGCDANPPTAFCAGK